jgi:hypothetical protein
VERVSKPKPVELPLERIDNPPQADGQSQGTAFEIVWVSFPDEQGQPTERGLYLLRKTWFVLHPPAPGAADPSPEAEPKKLVSLPLSGEELGLVLEYMTSQQGAVGTQAADVAIGSPGDAERGRELRGSARPV